MSRRNSRAEELYQISPITYSGGVYPFNDGQSLISNKRRKISEDSAYSNYARCSADESSTHGLLLSPPSDSSTTSFSGKYSEDGRPTLNNDTFGQRLPPPASLAEGRSSSWMSEEGMERRLTLPSLINITDRHQNSASYTSDYTIGAYTAPRIRNLQESRPLEPTMTAYSTHYPYGYQQPRGQPYLVSVPDRTPFSSPYSQPLFHEGYNHEMGHDSKQRKRRGNLPKDTTDKLRGWFIQHLTHPYPTEDEKQELMRQTNLQMSKSFQISHQLQKSRNANLSLTIVDQISNWFINARRRQLPTMISNAKAEEDARKSQNVERSSRCGTHSEGNSVHCSDDECSSPSKECDVHYGMQDNIKNESNKYLKRDPMPYLNRGSNRGSNCCMSRDAVSHYGHDMSSHEEHDKHRPFTMPGKIKCESTS